MKSKGRSKDRAGSFLLLISLVLLACTCGTGPLFGQAATPTSKSFPTVTPPSPPPPPTEPPFVETGGYNVYVRYLSNVDENRVNLLIGRLESAGYNVIIEAEDDMQGWSHAESAILYGNPACMAVIGAIVRDTGDIVDLSALPIYRFSSDDNSLNAYNIVIQLIDNSYFVP